MGVRSLVLVVFTFIAAVLAGSSLPKVDYDVIVVGGGPAGLSTLSGLGRVRRKALLFDDGHYRNGVTRHMHDVIGNDGAVPDEYRALARKQISRYTTTSIKNVRVATIKKENKDAKPGAYFVVMDVKGQKYTARKIVLGTGLQDIFPKTPGIMEAFGKGIYWCPWCDGWEHRDQPFGILGRLRDVMGSVVEIWSLNRDIIAFVDGTDVESDRKKIAERYPNWQKQLEKYNVKIDNRTIKSVERLQDGSKVYDPKEWREYDLFRLNFETGPSVNRSALITNYPYKQRSTLPDQLGLERDANDTNKIKVNINGMRTSLDGVFCVGDANNDGSTNVPHAMFSGKRAAVYVHVEIERENSLDSIQKRGTKFSSRSAEKKAIRIIGNDLEEAWAKAQKAK
ncbi:sulphydryl oxidase Sox [Arthroderma uncinatum]|uniref:sulphydryl oxidase Sox n=1 Tax=Arthroderma uncinatum TaxID=74035 RepID=UPI00144A515D|nr:sulphydryl oxidase Sox [Arthroderma uncinatum]KAF3480617.1 sulphydryl oxidase Sox [Arthroderma uncinatum]